MNKTHRWGEGPDPLPCCYVVGCQAHMMRSWERLIALARELGCLPALPGRQGL